LSTLSLHDALPISQIEVFHKDGDYRAFVELIGLLVSGFRCECLRIASCQIMRWMQWLLMAHVQRYHQHYRSSGHVWQGQPAKGSANSLWLGSHRSSRTLCSTQPASA